MMTRIATVLGVVLCLGIIGVSAAYSQTGARAKDPALQATIEGRQKAIDSRSAGDWAKYTSDDFTLVSTEGVIQSREDRMKAVAANTTKPAQIVIESVRMFGPDTAVTIQRNAGSAGPTRITLVWVRQGGVWKAASGHSSRVATK